MEMIVITNETKFDFGKVFLLIIPNTTEGKTKNLEIYSQIIQLILLGSKLQCNEYIPIIPINPININNVRSMPIFHIFNFQKFCFILIFYY